MNVASLTVGEAQAKGPLTYVPVKMSYRVPGKETLRVYVVVGEDPAVGSPRILNFLYPAEAGAPSWDLKSFLHQQLKR